jgi:hypothetical protein
MRTRSTALAVAVFLCSAAALADDAKPYKEGPVTQATYIKIKPGHFNDYMRYLDSTYKAEMEASKKAGLVLTYTVYSAESHNLNEPDLILTVTYPNFATLDKTDEFDAIARKVEGSLAAQDKGVADRGEYREILGTKTLQEMMLK